MVRVFSCHHFTKQDVVSIQDEPQAIYCDEDKLFVATRASEIQVLSIKSDTHTLLSQFPTIGLVTDIVYCRKEGFIATLERLEEDSHGHTAVRVYFCWENAVISQSVSVNIAGHRTSLRHEARYPEETCLQSDCQTPVKVIEIPLKDKVSGFALNKSRGELAVAVGKHILLYGLCHKTAASTGTVYRDIKCLLDLQFSFKIRYINLCEDFILCASHRQCHVVSLGTVQSQQVSNSSNLHLIQNGQRKNLYSRSKSERKPLESLLSWLNSEDINMNDKNYIVEDKNMINWDFSEDSMSEFERSGGLAEYSYQTAKNIYVASIHGKSKSTKSTEIKPTVVLKPKGMPKVIVEFEDDSSCHTQGSVESVISSHLYCHLALHDDHEYIKPSLVPVYKHTGGTETCGESETLVGMYCMISTAREGRLYSLMSDRGATLLAVYPFTTHITQVDVCGSLVYALSPAVLEMYTCHCTIDTIRSLQVKPSQKCGRTVTEPCMVGLQAFISLHSMVMSDSQLVLLSKMSADRSDDDCWSLYVLQKPTIPEWHQDLVELSSAYQFSNEQLLFEDYQMLLSHTYTRGASSTENDLLQGAALALGLYLAKYHPSEVSSCIQYLEESSYSPLVILENYLHMQTKAVPDDEQPPADGLLTYLDKHLLTTSVTIPQESVEQVISFYKYRSLPRLLYMVLTNRINTDIARDLTGILSKISSSQTRLKSLYSLSVLAMDSATSTTNVTLKSIPEAHIEKIVSLIPDCLQQNGHVLSASAQNGDDSAKPALILSSESTDQQPEQQQAS